MAKAAAPCRLDLEEIDGDAARWLLRAEAGKVRELLRLVEVWSVLDQSKQFSYFPGLRSQQPSSRITIYFLNVEAAWSGGFGHLHLRIRTIPPERTPLGVPCAIPPETEHRLVLEGVLSNLEASSPIEPFDANMSTLVNPPSDHWARRRRTGATF